MKSILLKAMAITLFLLAMPTKQFGQIKDYENGFLFNVFEISNVEERIQLASALAISDIWLCNPTDNPGELFIRPNSYHADIPIYAEFDFLRETLREEYKKASLLSKEEFSEIYNSWAQHISVDYYNFLISDYVGERANHCMDAEPFCTTDVYNFPAINSGVSWSGPNYGCLGSSPMSKQSFWYYMRVGVAGNITIKIEASFDVDFALWGPFNNETDPCPTTAGQTGMLTANCSSCPNNTSNPNFYPSGNLHDCSFSGQSYEYAHVVNGQIGQYYILLITNYAGSSGNITFQKYAGNGETDCGILPPLVSNGGPYCVGETIRLNGNAQAGATYSWTGPGGWTATGQNVSRPNCTMAMAGTYTCTISVGSATNSATTQVQVSAQPTANFNYTSVCKGHPTEFFSTCTTNPAGQQITSYQWNFGDGQTSTQQSPSHTYANAGNYNVTLNVSCGNCTSSKTQSVTVYEAPVANAGNDQNVTYGGTATLTGSGGNIGNFTYRWEPANMVVNPNAATTQTVALTSNQTYTLTVSNAQGGCSSTDQVTIHISGSNMTANASATPSSICQGVGTSTLRAQAGGGTGNYTYMWSPTTGLQSAPNAAVVTAQPDQTTTYTCQVSDGITTQNVTATVTVNLPEYTDEYASICPDEIYNFYGQPCQEEGTYTHQTTTTQGCEKIITLHLTHYPTYENGHTDFEYICPGESYNFHGQYYYASGNYPATLETIHGCDSVVWLNLTVYPANDTIVEDAEICVGQTYNFHGTNYSQNGATAYFDSVDYHGCRQVYKLELTVGDYQVFHEKKRICYEHDDSPSYTWDKNGVTYTEDTVDEVILPDPTGDCDHKYILDLKFHRKFYQKDEVATCDEYFWPVTQQTYTHTDHNIVHTFEDVVSQDFVCEGMYVLDLTIDYSNESNKVVNNQCDSYDWHFGWDNEVYTYTEKGDYTKTIHTSSPLECDSTVTLKLDLDYSPDFPRVEGNSWVVGGSEFQFSVEKFWIETHPKSTHTTTWRLKRKDGSNFNKWDIVEYGGPKFDSCLIYIYTFELDTIFLEAYTMSTGTCQCGTYTHSKPIICSFIGTQDHQRPCQAAVYPNPNDGSMYFSLDNMTGEVAVKVYDMTGTLVDHFSIYNGFEQQKHHYQNGHLSKGVYLFTFSSREGTTSKKVIID